MNDYMIQILLEAYHTGQFKCHKFALIHQEVYRGQDEGYFTILETIPHIKNRPFTNQMITFTLELTELGKSLAELYKL